MIDRGQGLSAWARSAAPTGIRRVARRVVTTYRLRRERKRRPCRLIVGSEGVGQEGWLRTDQRDLDLLRPWQWRLCFKPGSIDFILADHVWEHLSSDEGRIAAGTCFRFLRPGGKLRVAVPDGLHPDPRYIEEVRPGGVGGGAEDHKVLFTYETLGALFRSVGFEVSPLEYFDKAGEFHAQPWESEDGHIRRSHRYDPRNRERANSYTSIILDARKPAE